jgi:cytoskeletal protein RodZ
MSIARRIAAGTAVVTSGFVGMHAMTSTHEQAAIVVENPEVPQEATPELTVDSQASGDIAKIKQKMQPDFPENAPAVVTNTDLPQPEAAPQPQVNPEIAAGVASA